MANNKRLRKVDNSWPIATSLCVPVKGGAPNEEFEFSSTERVDVRVRKQRSSTAGKVREHNDDSLENSTPKDECMKANIVPTTTMPGLEKDVYETVSDEECMANEMSLYQLETQCKGKRCGNREIEDSNTIEDKNDDGMPNFEDEDVAAAMLSNYKTFRKLGFCMDLREDNDDIVSALCCSNSSENRDDSRHLIATYSDCIDSHGATPCYENEDIEAEMRRNYELFLQRGFCGLAVA